MTANQTKIVSDNRQHHATYRFLRALQSPLLSLVFFLTFRLELKLFAWLPMIFLSLAFSSCKARSSGSTFVPKNG